MNTVEYTVSDKIGYITLNRPDKRNALNFEMIEALKRSFDRAEADPSVKIVVIRANGEAFCAGADLAYLQQLQGFNYEENLKDSQHLKDLFYKVYTLKKIVIAQVQGHALAGGCGLATVCDFSFAVPEAKFGYTEVKIGFVPAIVMVFLIRKIGEGSARKLLIGGELITSDVAHSVGLINEVVSADVLERRVHEFALHLIGSNASEAMGMTKQMIATMHSLTLTDALQYAAEMNAKARETADCKEGIANFLSKKKIQWNP